MDNLYFTKKKKKKLTVSQTAVPYYTAFHVICGNTVQCNDTVKIKVVQV